MPNKRDWPHLRIRSSANYQTWAGRYVFINSTSINLRALTIRIWKRRFCLFVNRKPEWIIHGWATTGKRDVAKFTFFSSNRIVWFLNGDNKILKFWLSIRPTKFIFVWLRFKLFGRAARGKIKTYKLMWFNENKWTIRPTEAFYCDDILSYILFYFAELFIVTSFVFFSWKKNCIFTRFYAILFCTFLIFINGIIMHFQIF